MLHFFFRWFFLQFIQLIIFFLEVETFKANINASTNNEFDFDKFNETELSENEVKALQNLETASFLDEKASGDATEKTRVEKQLDVRLTPKESDIQENHSIEPPEVKFIFYKLTRR